jgi:hypothetical protein
MPLVETPDSPPRGRGRRRILAAPADCVLRVRLTTNEAAALAAAAAARGCSTSQLVRSALARDVADLVVLPVSRPPPERAGVDASVAALNRAIGLLKDALRRHGGQPAVQAELRGALASVIASAKRVAP